MPDPAQTWIAVGVVLEGDPVNVGGLNPWGLEWHSLESNPIELPHPSYPNQRHLIWVYEIRSGAKAVRFAAGELSANVWGFYVPS